MANIELEITKMENKDDSTSIDIESTQVDYEKKKRKLNCVKMKMIF